MDEQNEEPRIDAQAQEQPGELQQERTVRGRARDSHIEAGREQAQLENAEARGRSGTGSQDVDQKSELDNQEPQRVQEHLDDAELKAEARRQYEGTDEDFDLEWPMLRERLLSLEMKDNVEGLRRRL